MLHGKLSYPYCAGPAYTLRDPRIDGFLLPTQLSPTPIGKADRAGSNLDATESLRIRSHMLLSFQRPPAPWGGGSALRIRPPAHEKGLRRGPALLSVFRLRARRLASPWSCSSEGTKKYSAASAECHGRRSIDAQAHESALADLQHSAVQPLRGNVEIPSRKRLAVDLDA